MAIPDGTDPNTPVAFTQGTAQRIVTATKMVEARPWQVGGAQGNAVDADGIMFVKLTDRDGTDDRLYDWEEWRESATGMEIVPSGLSNTATDLPVLDPTDDAIRFDLTDFYVHVRRGHYRRNVAGTVRPVACWLVIGCIIPRPQYKDQQFGGIAANQVGYQFIKAHAMS